MFSSNFLSEELVLRSLRSGSDAVLNMSRIEFNELSSCEVRRLNRALEPTLQRENLKKTFVTSNQIFLLLL